jgi:S-adenosylmethionine hydrolase
MSNIGTEELKSFANQVFEIHFKHSTIPGLSDSYAAVNPGEPLAIVGSRGYVEIAVNCGNAAEYFNARKGESVRIIRRSPSVQ